MTDQNLKVMSVVDLLERLEKDIRYGCHSTRAEASRSFAGKELRSRGEEAVRAITNRLQVMNEPPPKDGLEARVRDGIEMILYWMTLDRVRRKVVGSADVSVTMQAGLSR
jgi:hypothetical protein